MQKERDQHTFALFYNDLYDTKDLCITDQELIHRISRVLRLQKDDTFIIFNGKIQADAIIQSIDKKGIDISLTNITTSIPYKPLITFMLPLLKKEAFEQAVYNLVSCGITDIQPFITQKSHRGSFSPSELDRLERIRIEAAQVSKNFAYTQLQPILSFQESLGKISGNGLFFDPVGISFQEAVKSINVQQPITLLIGPEGDLTFEEKRQLQKVGFVFCKLTPTILKAEQAALLAAGMMRSLL